MAPPLTTDGPPSGPSPARALNLSLPEVHAFETSDRVNLRLTRYRGGARGPVVLVHGLGVSSRIFSTDTIETNLLDYLYGHEFDVWLLDSRVSIDLPSALRQSTADDVALRDFPAALAKVRSVARVELVDMIVHCYGATSFFMAMLAGLEGVRSALCSQIATHMVAARPARAKAALRLPAAVRASGITSLSARASDQPQWTERFSDRMLRLYPLPAHARCDSATCRRISFIYGPLYRHEQLANGTHEGLADLFGPANISTLEHLARMVRRGHVVNAAGEDACLGRLGRLAIPITFVHGELNECYLPESTAVTAEVLGKANGRALYERHVIPGYGHIDCIFGRNAAVDVFPLILQHFERVRS